MAKQVKCYASKEQGAVPVPSHISRRALRDDDVEVDISFCGICHTDLHYVNNDWGMSSYPVVPGHEIVGTVAAVGKKSKFKVGEQVAVGTIIDSCSSCESCTAHKEQYCSQLVMTIQGKDRVDGSISQGGYAKSIVVNEHFVLKVPSNIFGPAAAPLLCAGITTWVPLKKWNIGPGKKVAVVGLGGLGHMALKLAKALGAYTALFTRSAEKGKDGAALGCDEIIVSTSEEQVKKAARKFDLIIDTIPYTHDVNVYVSCCAVDGVLQIVGFGGPLDPPLNTFPMLMSGISVTGSIVDGMKATQEMLDFCGKKNIVADVEIIKANEISDSYKRLLKGDVKYRFVIDNSTL